MACYIAFKCNSYRHPCLLQFRKNNYLDKSWTLLEMTSRGVGQWKRRHWCGPCEASGTKPAIIILHNAVPATLASAFTVILQTVRKWRDILNLFKPSNTFETAVSGNSIMQPLPWSILNMELKPTTLQITDCRVTRLHLHVVLSTSSRCGIANPDSSEFQDSPGSGSVCPSIPWSACHHHATTYSVFVISVQW